MTDLALRATHNGTGASVGDSPLSTVEGPQTPTERPGDTVSVDPETERLLKRLIDVGNGVADCVHLARVVETGVDNYGKKIDKGKQPFYIFHRDDKIIVGAYYEGALTSAARGRGGRTYNPLSGENIETTLRFVLDSILDSAAIEAARERAHLLDHIRKAGVVDWQKAAGVAIREWLKNPSAGLVIESLEVEAAEGDTDDMQFDPSIESAFSAFMRQRAIDKGKPQLADRKLRAWVDDFVSDIAFLRSHLVWHRNKPKENAKPVIEVAERD